MLVLSRKKEEVIVINRNIRVAVIDVRGDKVRLGIEAPAAIPIHRLEVEEAIAREYGRHETPACKTRGNAEILASQPPDENLPDTITTEAEISNQPPIARRRPKHNRIIGDLKQDRDELTAEIDRLTKALEKIRDFPPSGMQVSGADMRQIAIEAVGPAST